MAEEKRFYVIECTAEGVRAEFYVNDVAMVRRGLEWGYHYGGPVNEYIVSGRNEIAVLIDPGQSPGTAMGTPGELRKRKNFGEKTEVSYMLSAYPEGAVVGGPDRAELVSLSWQPEAGRPAFTPLVLSAAVDIAPGFGPWRWQEGPVLELTDAARGEVDAFVKEMHLALSGAMHEPFIDKSAVRCREVEEAYGLPAGERLEMIRSNFPEIMSRPEWGMEPLEGIDADYRLCGRSRLVELVAADWNAILRQTPNEEGGAAYFTMLISRLDGEWQIVR